LILSRRRQLKRSELWIKLNVSTSGPKAARGRMAYGAATVALRFLKWTSAGAVGANIIGGCSTAAFAKNI
jgi:hypothetical protein